MIPKHIPFTIFILVFAMLIAGLPMAQAHDPLPSWTDGKARQSIIDFVTKVTREGSGDFVPPDERIATFDNDGTLWAEHPMYFQLLFALDRVKTLAPQHPEWTDERAVRLVAQGRRERRACRR